MVEKCLVLFLVFIGEMKKRILFLYVDNKFRKFLKIYVLWVGVCSFWFLLYGFETFEIND